FVGGHSQRRERSMSIRYCYRLTAWSIALVAHLFIILAVAPQQKAEAQRLYVPGEILMKYSDAASPADIAVINLSYGLSIVKYIHEIGVYVLSLPGGRTVQEMKDVCSQDPRCQYAEPNYIGQGGDLTPNDTFFPGQ